MSTALRPLIARQYRARLRSLRDQITARARRLYGELDPAAINESFLAIAPQMALFIEAGKGSAASLSAAFLSQLALADAGPSIAVARPVTDVAKSGHPLAQAIRDYVVPGVLGAIAAGRPVADAIGYGDYLTTQFTDSEVLRAADETMAAARTLPHYAGWEGVVSADACDTCISSNSGRHGPAEPLYRHANCGCEEIPIFEGTYTVPELVPA